MSKKPGRPKDGRQPEAPALGAEDDEYKRIGDHLEALAKAHPADAEVLDRIGPQPVAARVVLEIARELDLDIWMSSLTRIEIDGLGDLPPRLRDLLLLYILLFSRSIGDLFLKEAGQ
jgi:hypothetical protein